MSMRFLLFGKTAFVASVLAVSGFVSAGSAGAADLVVTTSSSVMFYDGEDDSKLSISTYVDGNGSSYYEFETTHVLRNKGVNKPIHFYSYSPSVYCYDPNESTSTTPKVSSKSVVRCTSTNITGISLDAGGGDDQVTLTEDICPGGNLLIAGGTGDDEITFAPDCSASGGQFSIGDTAGNDVISLLGSNPVSVHVAGGNDTIKTGGGDDKLYLKRLTKGSEIDAGRGNDLIETESVAGSFYGGSGDDQIRCINDVDFSMKATTLGLCTGSFYGDRDDDQITVDRAKLIDGGSGNDQISAAASYYGLDIDGGDGNDEIEASQGDDTINGEKGNDTIVGNSGDDTINGEEGDDTIYGEYGNDVLSGGQGADRIYGGDGDDTVDPGLGEDDFVDTQDGNDTVNLTPNADESIATGEGNDTVNIAHSKESISDFTIITTASGDDRIYAADASAALYTLLGNGDDYMESGSGNDVICGSAGDDSLYGNEGKDRLIGASGDDHLDGGKGTDYLDGDSGDDVYVSGWVNPRLSSVYC